MNIKTYIKELNSKFSTRQATEHSYRSALEKLLKEVAPDILVINEQKRTPGVGAPDFVLTRNNIPLGYIETKDIGKNLDDPAYKEQLDRYAKALDNLIFTNYTEFRLFRGGEQVKTVNIADLTGGRVKPLPDNFESFKSLLQTFINYQGLTIKTASDLADYMAAKARMLAREIESALSKNGDTNDEVQEATSALQSQLEVFRKNLIRDIKPAEFADIYAQTVAYGMFAARLYDKTSDTFSRQEAAELIPVSNPFLRKFFQHIAGYDLDRTIRWIVDELADLFRAADVGELMKEYGKATQKNDPFLHFYETFLSKYNSKLRKSRGVYYTPEPVVNFITRAVDDILQKEFGLSDGIAHTGKISIEIDPPKDKSDKDKVKVEKIKKELHKVQILDPAAGTGTFLAAIAQWIYQERYANQKGIWESYVRDHLIPRLNGFELLMAPYTMAHTKLEMVLRETGCESQSQDRLRIFLTNSLEDTDTDTGSLLAEWLSIEAKEANAIKRDTPVMVVIGNPPYAVSSSNKGHWIQDLLKDYKKNLNEKKLNLDDDYIKFIRYGEHLIEKTGYGILAYISNNSFLDGLTHRQIRKHLLETFDKIYIIDLHGNSKKKETAPDGSTDRNVFDIQQGVSINLFVKTGKKKEGELGKVFHYDLWGSRESKYQFLWDKDLNSIDFTELKPLNPYYFFVPKDWANKDEYDKGFSVKELFTENLSGIVTARDSFTVYHTARELKRSIAQFRAMDDETARVKFSLGPDNQNWKINWARKDLEENVFGNGNDKAVPISYRPFDIRYTYYTGNSKGFHCRPIRQVMQHFLAGENIGLIFKRGGIEEKAAPVFLSKYISECRSWSRPGMQGAETSAPLYLYTNPPPTLNNKILRTRKNASPTLI